MTETTQPDPQVVAWMRERMESPLGLTGKDVRAHRVATGLSDEVMKAAYEAAMAVPDPHAADLALVCETAFEWAGEYGFASPDRATKVWDAAKRLRPDLEPKRS